MRVSVAAALCAAVFVFADPLRGLSQDVLTTHRLSCRRRRCRSDRRLRQAGLQSDRHPR